MKSWCSTCGQTISYLVLKFGKHILLDSMKRFKEINKYIKTVSRGGKRGYHFFYNCNRSMQDYNFFFITIYGKKNICVSV